MPWPLPPAELRADPYELVAIGRGDWRLEQALSRLPDVVRWTHYPPDLSDDEAQARAGQIEEAGIAGRLRRYRIMLGGDALGAAGISVAEEVDVFYALLPAGRGRGAATVSTKALADWALAHGAPRVRLLTIVGNTASEAVARRCGFAVEGREVRQQRGKDVEILRWHKNAPA